LYNLFVFDVPFSTLHLFTAKIKVLHRPIEVTAKSRCLGSLRLKVSKRERLSNK
jgi:hypothetical protein